MICWMEKSATNESILPYPAYKYHIHRSNRQLSLYYSIVPIDSVIRPACLIAHAAQLNMIYHGVISGRNKYNIYKNKCFTVYHTPSLSEIIVKVLWNLLDNIRI